MQRKFFKLSSEEKNIIKNWRVRENFISNSTKMENICYPKGNLLAIKLKKFSRNFYDLKIKRGTVFQRFFRNFFIQNF